VKLLKTITLYSSHHKFAAGNLNWKS